MKKNILQLIKTSALIMTFSIMAGCGQKTEAVITTDGEEMTDPVKQYETLSESHADKFTYKDLTVGKVKYHMTEQQVIAVLGNPVTVYDSTEKSVAENMLAEKVYSYNDLTLIFTKEKDDYLLTAAASTSDQDIFSRGIKVGDNLDTLLNLYYRDADCMNNYWYSEDKTAVLGKYLYGDYTMDDLEKIKSTDQVSYGVINFNGETSMETAQTYIAEFTCFQPPYSGTYATVNDDFAQMAFDIDNNGVITAIRWYYYPEEDNKIN